MYHILETSLDILLLVSEHVSMIKQDLTTKRAETLRRNDYDFDLYHIIIINTTASSSRKCQDPRQTEVALHGSYSSFIIETVQAIRQHSVYLHLSTPSGPPPNTTPNPLYHPSLRSASLYPAKSLFLTRLHIHTRQHVHRAVRIW